MERQMERQNDMSRSLYSACRSIFSKRLIVTEYFGMEVSSCSERLLAMMLLLTRRTS